MSAMQPTKFEALAGFVDKQPIPCVEGVLSTLYPVDHTKKDGTPIQFPKQNGVLKDGAMEHRITFDAKCEQPMDMKGRRIRITSNVGQHGMTGIKMDRYNEQYPKISVTSSAKVEVVGSNGTPSSVAQPQATRAQAPQSKPAERAAADNPPFETRVALWLKGLDVVCQGLGMETNSVIAAITPDKVAEITTGFVMSFKDGYVYHSPHFMGGQAVAQQMEEQVARSAEVTGELNAMDWRSFEYREKTLGDRNEKEMAVLFQWVDDIASGKTEGPKSEAGKQLKACLEAARAEKPASYKDDMADEDQIPY